MERERERDGEMAGRLRARGDPAGRDSGGIVECKVRHGRALHGGARSGWGGGA